MPGFSSLASVPTADDGAALVAQVTGAAQSILPLLAGAAAAVRVAGAAASTLALAGQATGLVGAGARTGSAGGGIGLGGAAAGRLRLVASGTGGLPFTGIAAAAVRIRAVATGGVPITGLASQSLVLPSGRRAAQPSGSASAGILAPSGTGGTLSQTRNAYRIVRDT